MIRVELIESNGMHVSADVWGAEVIHNGSDCGVVVLHENLSPSSTGIPVTKGDTVVLYEPESQDLEMERVKVYGEKDVENLRSTINSFVFQKYYETIRNEGRCISFEKMSEKEQEAYIKAHPEFVQKMQKIARNAGNFSKQMNQMTAALSGYEAKMGKLAQDYANAQMREENHSYEGIAKKYNSKLKKLYDQICATDDAAKVDALYAEADELLYKYRLEAAKEYRASLQRQITEAKKFAAEYARLSKEVVASGDLPECAIGRTDLNAVIMVGNLLDEAYKDLPELENLPVCRVALYTLPKGWNFGVWECRGFMGSVDGFKVGGGWPLLADNRSGDQVEYAVVENGKFRKINEDELKRINKQADQRLKSASKNKPPYGTYKSRSGQRVVEYSKTGELIVNGMTTFYPVAFTAKDNALEWIVLDGEEIVKCTYKL